MKLSELIRLYDCKVYTKDLFEDIEFNFAFCADLMSDALMILNSVQDDTILKETILITGLTTNQSIRTAEMLDIRVVLLVRGKIPSLKVVDLAIDSKIILLSTEHTMFNISGLLYEDGIRGITYNHL